MLESGDCGLMRASQRFACGNPHALRSAHDRCGRYRF